MRLILKGAAIAAAAILGFCTLAAPASAQATRTWVSGVGDDVNPCSRTAPCHTFAGAISKTATGGTINCLDPAGFGAVNITKSVSIICDGMEAGITASGNFAITVNSSTAYVTLSGLDLDGIRNTGSPGTHGVRVIAAKSVHIRNTKIRSFGSGYGVDFSPTNDGAALFIDNSVISGSGLAGVTTSGGVNISPAAGMSATATITNTQIVDNFNVGLRADTTGISGSKINVTLGNVVLSNDDSGILVKAPNGTGTVKFLLNDSTVTNNANYGIIINGTPTSAVARVGNTTITNNGQGVLVLGTATALSYGDNRLDNNTTDGAFSGTIAKH